MYYPCSENKGPDQLRGYREADLRLCFRICRLLVFPMRRLIRFEKKKSVVRGFYDKSIRLYDIEVDSQVGLDVVESDVSARFYEIYSIFL